jgi:phytoene/squalene synthetase
MPAQQVKVPAETKREIELFAALTGRTQSDLLAESWAEYRDRHREAFREGVRWASAIIDRPSSAAIAASGMSASDLDDIHKAVNGS